MRGRSLRPALLRADYPCSAQLHAGGVCSPGHGIARARTEDHANPSAPTDYMARELSSSTEHCECQPNKTLPMTDRHAF